MKKKPGKVITISIRAPESLSLWLDKKSQENRRSKSAEIVLHLLAVKDKQAN